MNTIPAITDPLGKYWKQPDTSLIAIDDEFAAMSRATFDALAEYSLTSPTGVYPGKTWKRHDGIRDQEFLRGGAKPEWLLCWFGESEKGPKWCSNNSRKIKLTDGELP